MITLVAFQFDDEGEVNLNDVSASTQKSFGEGKQFAKGASFADGGITKG